MEDVDVKHFLDVGNDKKEIYMSYCDIKSINEIIINFYDCKLISDKLNNSKQNILFNGYIIKCYVNHEVYENEIKMFIEFNVQDLFSIVLVKFKFATEKDLAEAKKESLGDIKKLIEED